MATSSWTGSMVLLNGILDKVIILVIMFLALSFLKCCESCPSGFVVYTENRTREGRYALVVEYMRDKMTETFLC